MVTLSILIHSNTNQSDTTACDGDEHLSNEN
jgi:hypothetical protein